MVICSCINWHKRTLIKHCSQGKSMDFNGFPEFGHFLVKNQWIPFWILMDLLENCWLHQAITFCLFGVRSQPRYLKVSTPRAWSIARVKSRVARFYEQNFSWWSVSNFSFFSFGDADHPSHMKANLRRRRAVAIEGGFEHNKNQLWKTRHDVC